MRIQEALGLPNRLLQGLMGLALGVLAPFGASAAIPDVERQVLLDLYSSTNGANWMDNTGWGDAVGTECTWFGVTCDDSGLHVIGIALDSNSLIGTLPSLDGLTHLESAYRLASVTVGIG